MIALAVALDMAVVAAQPGCLVRDRVHMAATVRPPGEPEMHLDIDEMEVEARIGAGGKLQLTAEDVLEFPFDGETGLVVRARTGSPVWTAIGGSEIAAVRAFSGGRLRADVKLDEGVWAEQVEIPCAAVALAARTDPPEAPVDGAVERPAKWVPRGRRIVLTERLDGGGARVAVRMEDPRMLPLTEWSRSADRVRVSWSDHAGGRLQGWARANDLAPAVEGVGRMGHLFGTAAGAACGGIPDYMDPMIYAGPATVHAGAPVFAAPDGGGRGRWATVRGKTELRIVWKRGDPFARIERLPGLASCSQDDLRAFVRRSDLDL